MLRGFFQDLDFIVVLQTGFGSGSGFLPLASGLESDSKKLESEHLCRKPCRLTTGKISGGSSFLQRSHRGHYLLIDPIDTIR